MTNRLLAFLYAYSHLGVFLALLATGFGLPIPEDIILVTGGVIAENTQTFILMNFIGLAGVLTGDMVIYSLGYKYGERLLRKRPFVWLVTPERLRKVRGYYRKYGYWAIFISRFLAGLRATSFLLAGLSHVPFHLFILADGLAALISVPVFIGLGFYFSDNIQSVMAEVKAIQEDFFLILVCVLVVVFAWRWLKKRRANQAAKKDSIVGDDDSQE